MYITRDGFQKHPWVIAKIGLHVETLRTYLDSIEEGTEWVNVDINRARNGKLYAERNHWSPSNKTTKNEEEA